MSRWEGSGVCMFIILESAPPKHENQKLQRQTTMVAFNKWRDDLPAGKNVRGTHQDSSTLPGMTLLASRLVSTALRCPETSRLKLKSVGAMPVINLAPRLKVMSWTAH